MFTIALGVLLLVSEPDREPKPVTLTGQIVLLSDELAARGLVVDEEPHSGQVVLRCDDGRVLPILSDPASRALFLDERLRDQPARIDGRMADGFPFLQVIRLWIMSNGTYQTPEYYCDVCTIRVRFPQICPCCQGPLELRFLQDEP